MSKLSKYEKLVIEIYFLAKELATEKNKTEEVQKVFDSYTFESFDLKAICKLEAILGESLLLIPNKQQWRKIKLEKLKNI